MLIHNRRSWLAIALLAVLLAPAASSAEESSIAIIDTIRAVSSSKEGKSAKALLDKLSESKRDMLRPREAELKRLQEEFEAQRFVLSKEALQGREIDLVKRRRDLERDFQAAKEDMQIEERRLMDPLIRKVVAAAKQVGQAQGYKVILEKSAPGIMYYHDALDVTDLIIERMNEGS
jgi:outer membrane protein